MPKSCYLVLHSKRIVRISEIQKLWIFIVHYPWANAAKVNHEYGIALTDCSLEELRGQFDAVVLGVAHDAFKKEDIRSFLKNENGVIYDVKGMLDREVIDGRL